MQQTQKYQFNLIESSDTFSAQPLNDNMEKLEGALITHQAEVDATLTAHRTEVSAALTTHRTEVSAALAQHKADTAQALGSRARFIAGSYTGTGEYGAAHPCSIELDPALGAPIAIFVVNTDHGEVYLFMEGVPFYYSPCIGHSYCPVTWTGHGVSWYNTEHENHQMNLKDQVYPYLILF